MNQIIMLETTTGAVNGLLVKTFNSGDIINVDGDSIDQDLADVFVRNRKANIFIPETVEIIEEPKKEEKAINPKIENKAMKPVKYNKGK